MSQYAGRVQWFHNAKGYGFVSRDDGGKDVFLHYSSIESDGYKTLQEGDLVQYDIVKGKQGLQADKVLRLKQASE